MDRASERARARDAVLAPAASAGVISLSGDLELAQFDRYELLASIGRGGMAHIYLARRRNKPSAPIVALKVLVKEGDEEEDLVAMFIDEATIMSQVEHPNVLRVYDFGREGDRYFLAMEYLAGRPLVRVMIDAYAKDDGLDLGVVASIGAHAARGLHAAHTATNAQGNLLHVVHRDISPQNIFVTNDGCAKILDFGVARAAERLAHTSTGQLKGKAAYMSPEQVQGQIVDRQSDIFSLGVCLWEMVAGRRLFKRENEWETMNAVASRPVIPPSKVRGRGDPKLDAIIMRALERDLGRRFKEATALADQLEGFVKARQRRGPSAQSIVAALMRRLYGAEADEERRLVEQLTHRGASDIDVERLRVLSAIAPSPYASREVTLASQPGSLAALDDFGQRDSSASHSDRAQRSLSEDSDEDATTVDPSEIDVMITAGPAAVRRAAQALAQERRHQQRTSTDVGMRPALLRTPADPLRRAERPMGRLVAIIAGLGLLSVLSIILLGDGNLLGRGTAIDHPGNSERASIEPVEIVVGDSNLEAQANLRRAIEAFVARGLSVTRIGDLHLVADREGHALWLDEAVGLIPFREGYVAVVQGESLERNASIVVWHVDLAGDAGAIVPLSIGTCGKAANESGDSIRIEYGLASQSISPDIARIDVTVVPPPGAHEVTLMPLGLTLSRPGGASAANAAGCAGTWVGDSVTFVRLPSGSYSLVWSGDQGQVRQILEIPSHVGSMTAPF